MAKVVRVFVYEGDPQAIQATLEASRVPVNGSCRLSENLRIVSAVTTVEGITCLGCGKPTTNKTLFCNGCDADAWRVEVRAKGSIKREVERV